jgi:signal transduction histidine kinase
VLCLPILQQARIHGALYLENRLSPGLLTRDKVRMVELLTAQAAISLENAQLIEDMRRAQEAIEQLNTGLEQRVKEEVAHSREKDHLLIRQSWLAAMGEMVGNIAHQWRQLLNALSLVLENIQDATHYGELTPDYLDGLMADAQRLIAKTSSTINDFRNFFKPDKQRELFGVKKTIEEALLLVAAGLRARAIVVEMDAPEEIWMEGYPNEYAQVLLNLLTNAKEAIQERGVELGRIVLRLRREGGSAHLTVADNGGGIEESARNRIFEPYFSTKEGGTGIGLYMSKMIIENNMAGRIEVRNAEQGAEFTIMTPIAASRCEGKVPADEVYERP